MLVFWAFGRKTQCLGNFEKIFLRKFRKCITFAYEILRKFSKNILRKLRKSYYFSIFFKKFSKPWVTFLARLDEKLDSLEILRNFSKF